MQDLDLHIGVVHMKSTPYRLVGKIVDHAYRLSWPIAISPFPEPMKTSAEISDSVHISRIPGSFPSCEALPYACLSFATMQLLGLVLDVA
jgi:hypothetical protein